MIPSFQIVEYFSNPPPPYLATVLKLFQYYRIIHLQKLGRGGVIKGGVSSIQYFAVTNINFNNIVSVRITII